MKSPIVQSDPSLPKQCRFFCSHPKELIIGDPSKGVSARTSARNLFYNCAFISQFEQKKFKEVKFDKFGFKPCKVN